MEGHIRVDMNKYVVNMYEILKIINENLKKYIIYCISSKPVVDLTTELRGTVLLCVGVTWQAMILNKTA